MVLQVGLDMPVPIPDLRVDDSGVYATLSFQRTPFTCMVPWEAVFALVGDDGKGMVWPDDLPPEIAAEVEREAHRHRDEEQKSKPEKRGPGRAREPRGDGAPRVPASLRRSGNGNGADDSAVPPRLAPAPALAAGLEPSGGDGEREADDETEISRASPRRPIGKTSGASSAKKKRRVELPPYLRVIK